VGRQTANRTISPVPPLLRNVRPTLLGMADLTHVVLLTENVAGLTAFYMSLLNMEPAIRRTEYTEIQTARATLAIYSIGEQQRIAPGSSAVRANRTVMVEFEVPDLDAELSRLKNQPIEWVTQPTVHEWGTRSVYLRDPEGNLVTLYEQLGTM
jgi:catechol 2,3-dioxygenase-like lactoylglutathione lyase family enzyme